MRTEILQKLYHLKSQPFPDAYEGTLDPATDPTHLSLYFDLYDWNRSPLLQQISPQHGLAVFPNATVLAGVGSVLILITGSNQTGRKSLRNLLFHKIAEETPLAQRAPIITRLELEEGDRAENIKRIARAFVNTYSRLSKEPMPVLADLQQIFTETTADRAVGDQAYYSDLFQLWKDLIRLHCSKPLVLSLAGISTYNTLRVIFNSTRHLFNFIVVTTASPTDAETCRQLLIKENRSVNLIESQKLDRVRTLDLVRSRLIAERIPDSPLAAESLEPYSIEALDALFEEGPTFRPGEKISWHVQFLDKTLRLAFEIQLATLAHQARDVGIEALQKLEMKDRSISVEHIRKARRMIQKT